MSKPTNAAHGGVRRTGQVALGLGILLLAGACATPSHPDLTPREPKTFTFTIAFKADPAKPERLCPKSAVADERNCDEYGKKADCVKVRRRDTVSFVSDPLRTSFDVYFGPSRPEKAPSGSTSIVIDPDAPRKDYRFSVVSETCKDEPLDPWIIVM